MTEVMTSREPGKADFSGGGAGRGQGAGSFQIFPDSHERYPKLSKRLPSIVVEPTDGAEVESGELRWPPDEQGSSEAPAGKQTSTQLPQTTEDQATADEGLSLEVEEEEEEVSEADGQDSN